MERKTSNLRADLPRLSSFYIGIWPAKAYTQIYRIYIYMHTHTHTGKHSFSLLLRWVDAVFGTANNCPKNNQLSTYKYEMSLEQLQAKAKEGEGREGKRGEERERGEERDRVSERESEFVDVDFVVWVARTALAAVVCCGWLCFWVS